MAILDSQSSQEDGAPGTDDTIVDISPPDSDNLDATLESDDIPTSLKESDQDETGIELSENSSAALKRSISLDEPILSTQDLNDTITYDASSKQEMSDSEISDSVPDQNLNEDPKLEDSEGALQTGRVERMGSSGLDIDEPILSTQDLHDFEQEPGSDSIDEITTPQLAGSSSTSPVGEKRSRESDSDYEPPMKKPCVLDLEEPILCTQELQTKTSTSSAESEPEAPDDIAEDTKPSTMEVEPHVDSMVPEKEERECDKDEFVISTQEDTKSADTGSRTMDEGPDGENKENEPPPDSPPDHYDMIDQVGLISNHAQTFNCH